MVCLPAPTYFEAQFVVTRTEGLCIAVARIALVKPDKAEMVENLCLQMAQRGQLTEKVPSARFRTSLAADGTHLSEYLQYLENFLCQRHTHMNT